MGFRLAPHGQRRAPLGSLPRADPGPLAYRPAQSPRQFPLSTSRYPLRTHGSTFGAESTSKDGHGSSGIGDAGRPRRASNDPLSRDSDGWYSLALSAENREAVPRFPTRGNVLRRNLLIALVVGSVLSTVNQMAFLLGGPITPGVLLKIAFNYLVPFTVASVSASLNRRER